MNEQPKNEPRPSMTATPIPKPKLPKHLADESTVAMHFPRALSLNLDEYAGLVHFTEGLNEVPVSLATEYAKSKENPSGMHWHLYRNGVKLYEKPKPPVSEHHVEFLQSRGYEVKTVEGAQAFVENLDPKDRAGFFAEALDWKPKEGQPEEEEDETREIPLAEGTEEQALDSAQAPDQGKVAKPTPMEVAAGKKKRA